MKDKIKELILDKFQAYAEEDDNLFELGFDDIDIISLGLIVEDEFGVFLNDEDLEQVRTINDIVNLIE